MCNKKFLLLTFALLVSVFVLSSTAFALSDKEYKQFMRTPEFAKADKALNAAWQNAKNSLDGNEFETLKKNQRSWVKSGRDNEAKPLLRKMKRVQAYAIVTDNRAKYINDYVQNLTRGNDDDDENFDIPDENTTQNSEESDSNDDDLPSDSDFSDIPDDLPEDVPESPKKSSSENKNSNQKNISSQEDAKTQLEEKLYGLDKIAMNETLDFISEAEINGENCWVFSTSFNFNETGRYAISKSGKIYEFEDDNFSPIQ